ncbi:two-component system response regulator YesN [Paenibacillus forsythiae]|uniref:Two-component system response regulator YesN n=1 Tax=Paenibacillus forsythiae TaxID=365616 RepID=A0ABU3HE84_9BACL|nr:response regulator [Paenibacillus forsythiae]MDT3429131.1 two-component system response regulator YesN [Paenibacillus forsythiae]
MYKVLIVDDERPVRTAIRLAGEWEKLAVSEIAEAPEAQTGLQMLEAWKPDIVLVDIRMPVMDGMEMLRRASARHPEVKYIIISGFDEFEYARQAIHCRVLDYLLKPIDKVELNRALSEAVRQLEEERKVRELEQQQRMMSNLSMPLFKEKLLTMIIDGDRIHPPILEDYKRLTSITKQHVLYGCAIVQVLNFDEVCASRFKGDSFSCYFALTNMIDECCAPWSQGFSFRSYKTDHEIIAVLEMGTGPDPKVFSAAKITEMLHSLRTLFGFVAIAGIGGFSASFEQLGESYYEACAIKSSINILQSGNRVLTEIQAGRKAEMYSIMNKKELLLRAFESGNIEFTRGIMNGYFDLIQQTGYFSMDDARKSAAEFILMIEDITVQLGIAADSPCKPVSCGTAPVHPSFEDFRGFVFRVISLVFDRIQTGLKDSEAFNIIRIKNYIDDHFFTDINLAMFSEQYYLSKEYLSRLFKEKFGFGIYEYVLKVRMDRAKELLDDPSIKIQLVSSKVGFNDNAYFSKAFKKYTGLSPSEYRSLTLQSKKSI